MEGESTLDTAVSLSYKELLSSGTVVDKFCKAIVEFSEKTGSSGAITFGGDSYTLTAFGSGSVTPFSRFVGTHAGKVVVVSRGPSSQESPETLYDESITSVQSPDTGGEQPPFMTITHKKVPITRVLKHKVFLTQTESFPPKAGKETVAIDTNVRPLPLQIARYLASCVTLWCRRGNHIHLPEVWLPCERNTQSIVAIGCSLDNHSEKVESLFLYQVYESGLPLVIGNNKAFSIRANSFLPSSSRKQEKQNSSDISWISSLYEFGPCIGEGNESSSVSQITMEFVWESPRPLFTPPPTTTADVVLNISSTPGYLYSPVLPVFKEIQILVQLAEIASGVSDWSSIVTESEDILSGSSCSSNNTLLTRTRSFLEESAAQTLRAVESSMISPAAQCSLFQPREDLDFIGQLWMFASSVSDPADLVESFGVVFTSVLLGHVQPYIHHTKSSLLAVLFRQSLSTNSVDERQVVATKLQALLTEEKALRCLVEIGLEKMERDYSWYFVSNGLATLSDIDVFFRSQGSLLERVQRLCSLHCVLELTADLMTFVTLPVSSVSLFVRKAISHYQDIFTERFETTPTFCLPFPSLSTELKSLAVFASSLTPSSMSVTTSGSRQVILGTANPLFKYLYSSPLGEEEEKDDPNETSSMYLYYASCDSVPL